MSLKSASAGAQARQAGQRSSISAQGRRSCLLLLPADALRRPRDAASSGPLWALHSTIPDMTALRSVHHLHCTLHTAHCCAAAALSILSTLSCTATRVATSTYD